jgi:GntR family transcriptional regulator
MTVLRVHFRPGESIFDQVVFAAKKAFVGGEFQPGQVFPSVRTLAAELKIHPNTAHKIIQRLVQERWLEVRPGVGTIVATPPEARPGDRKRLLDHEVEQIVVEAKRVGLDLKDVVDAIAERWSALDKSKEAGKRR